MADHDRSQGRQVLAGPTEVQTAVHAVTRSASRTLAIFTQDLAPAIYDQIEFVEAVKEVVLGRRYAVVRVIVAQPGAAVQRGHRFIEAARSLASFIQIRRAHEDDAGRRDDFLVADRHGLFYRADASRYEAVIDPHDRRLARRYLKQFDAMWDKSESDPEFRRLHL